ncbi:MAG: FimV/HubP family polar landmark protein [Burkholderiales bacterium]
MPRLITIIRVGALGSLSLRAWIFAGVLLSLSAASHAAGLGQLNVLSALGEPFRAEIDVIAKKSELGSLSVQMATPAAFQNAGLSYTGDIAAMRVTLDKRDSGEPFVAITSTESLNEPFIDLLVELSWAAGRITRQFTALLDPPFIVAERERQAAERARREAEVRAAPTQPAPQPEPLPEAIAEAPVSEPVPASEPPATDLISEPETPETAAMPEPLGPVETIGGTAPTLFSAEPSFSSAPTADSYGPVKRGDTLYEIARDNKRAELTIEQMLVLLFRNNPEAFIGQNMNRMRTGKILRLPDASQFGAVSPADARREVRVQAADWNAYRERLAAAAAQEAPSAEPAEQMAKGQIAPRVEDKAPDAQQPKEVVKLSKGEPASGDAPGAGQTAGTRAMEEELVAREKALTDANTRIARLEKTIKDLQALVEVKSQGMADLQQQAGEPSAPEAPTPEDKALAAPAAEQTPPARTESAPPAPARETAPSPAAPAQQARPRPAPPPPPPPSLLDQVLEQPLYLAGLALGVLVIGLLALRVVKRRREAKGEVAEEVAPAASAGGAAAFSPTETDVGLSSERSRDIAEEVDPLEEAEIFLAYGRDAQAEELLKEALTVHPNRHEIHLKLLEIYAKRKDARAFEGAANQLEKATGGKGDLWDRVVALGYQVSPDNPRYAAGRTEGDEAPEAASETERLDLDIGLGGDAESTTATDIDLGEAGEFDRTQIMSAPPAEEDSEPAFGRTTQSPAMDFEADAPAAEPSESASDADEAGAKNANAIDFDFDVSKLSAGEPEAGPEPEQEAKSDNGLDFDIGTLSLDTGSGEEEEPQSTDTMPSIDLSNISLDMDSATTSPTSPVGKDEKWYEVQTKFDLAKAYQEMGDKDGAREILREVIAEGDAEQKAAAQEVLSSLE